MTSPAKKAKKKQSPLIPRVAYLAGELATALKTRQPELNITDKDILCVQIAGLCHDLGHGPFSHLYDDMFLPKALGNREWKHEQGSCDMLDHLLKQNENELELELELGLTSDDMTFIKEMIVGPLQEAQGREWPYKGRPKEKAFLYEIVSNERNSIDVDKFDYLARDSYHLGIKNNFDYHRFMKFARVCEVDGKKTICTRDKEEDHMYDLFYTRHRLHKRACQHRVNKVIEHMIAEAFLKADVHIKIKGSEGKLFTLSTAFKDMEAYTKLTDKVFEEILHSSCPELQEARKILEDIYRSVGETRPKNPIQDYTSLISVWKEKLALPVQDTLTPEDFEIQVVNMDYGKKDEDPIKHMHFYSKSEPDEAKSMSKDQASRIRTTCFSEQLIRVFCKKTDDKSVEAARQHFDQWLKTELNLVGPEGNQTDPPEADGNGSTP